VEEIFSIDFIQKTMDITIEKIRRKPFKNIIPDNILQFRSISGCSPINLPNSYQIVAYESRKIYTAYINNIECQLGHWIRGVSNDLLKIKERKSSLAKELKAKGHTEQRIAEAVKQQILDPGKTFKEAISSRKIDIHVFDDATNAVYNELLPFFNAYPPSYDFEDKNASNTFVNL
jgi:hypothetical protein